MGKRIHDQQKKGGASLFPNGGKTLETRSMYADLDSGSLYIHSLSRSRQKLRYTLRSQGDMPLGLLEA